MVGFFYLFIDIYFADHRLAKDAVYIYILYYYKTMKKIFCLQGQLIDTRLLNLLT